MSESSHGTSASREYARIALVACCLLATVLAAVLVPTLTDGGLSGSPAESLVPGEAISGNASGGSAVDPGRLEGEPGQSPGRGSTGQGGTGTGGFGALNPGDRTDVGGTRPLDESGNAFRSQDTSVHLTVRSPRPAYWRTGSYDEYTGSGWEQTGDPRPYAGPIEGGGIRGPRVEYRATLNRTATAVPTVWRPSTVDGPEGLQVTAGRAVHSRRALGPGTTYTGVSFRPPRDPALLRSTGRDYPEAIEERYTRLGSPVTSRLERFTDNVTADADTPYEEARAIERWLETNKEYSLNVSRTSNNMAETFVYDMERGYCEYFATSMVVMLRSQDVPARYVVGYSTGQRVGENTYEVRGMNAHAWVEVYFEDAGWVKFDPTPGSARLQRERQSMRDERPETDYAPREQGSPGEEFSPGNGTGEPGGTPTPGSTPTDSDGGDGDDVGTDGQTNGYDVSLNRSAVPGATVTVTVTRDGRPASGRVVLFDGERVGTTDADGRVTATVPYADELRIDVGETTAAALAPADGAASYDRLSGDRLYSVRGVGQGQVTVPVETNATVTVSGDRIPGGTVAVTASVEGVPVRDAAVLVDGEQVATTDGDGRARVELPGSPGNVTVAVERDPVRGETTVAVPDLTVSVAPTAPLALPFTDATVEVRAGDDPVGGAPVRLDGRQVATTDFNGTATVSLPPAPSATVSVTARGLTRETTVVGLFVNVLLVLGLLALLVGGLLYAAFRRGHAPRDVAAFLRRLPGLAVRYGKWLLVALARDGDELLARVLERLRKTAGYLRAVLGGRVSLAQLRARLFAWLRERRREVHSALRRQQTTPTPRADGPGGGLDDGRVSVREAWTRFLDHVSVRRRRTKTPGEIARHAVDRDGLPAAPVRVLRDSFREVEYGSRPAEERLDRVDEALTAIERSVDGDAEPGARPDGGRERRRGEQHGPGTERPSPGERGGGTRGGE